MDFIQNIGQSYLERKANQAPYTAENLVKKQFTGSKDTEKAIPGDPTATHVGRSRAGSVAPSAGGSGRKSRGKDAELKRLREELAAYNLGQEADEDEVKSLGTKQNSVELDKGTKENQSGDRNSKGSVSRLEKGGVSRPRHRSESPKLISKVTKGAVKLAALDQQVEKDGTSTRKKSKAFGEVDDTYAEEHQKFPRRRSPAASVARSIYSEYSPDRASRAPRKHKPSDSASAIYAHATSYARDLPSEVGTVNGKHDSRSSPGIRAARSHHTSHSSRDSSSEASTLRGRHNTRNSLDHATSHKQHGSSSHHPSRAGPASGNHSHPSHRSSQIDPLNSDDDDLKSEHGGSAALLHTRQKYRQRYSPGAVPELLPIEKRPECCGEGFRPCRIHGTREIGIVEVFEDKEESAPRAREVARRHEHEGKLRGKIGVVEVGRGDGGRTLYKVR